jgi:hypothetical protein
VTVGGFLFLFGPSVALLVAGGRAASTDQTRSPGGLLAVSAAGALAWLVFVATVPHHNGGETVFGMRPLFVNDAAMLLPLSVMIGAAAIAGWRRVAAPLALGAATVIGAFAMAFPTTPRGDDDGLWGLVFVVLPLVGLLAAATASMCGAAARLLSRRRSSTRG